jgi:hypothetical protein
MKFQIYVRLPDFYSRMRKEEFDEINAENPQTITQACREAQALVIGMLTGQYDTDAIFNQNVGAVADEFESEFAGVSDNRYPDLVGCILDIAMCIIMNSRTAKRVDDKWYNAREKAEVWLNRVLKGTITPPFPRRSADNKTEVPIAEISSNPKFHSGF